MNMDVIFLNFFSQFTLYELNERVAANTQFGDSHLI